jgi:hypothetical protein
VREAREVAQVTDKQWKSLSGLAVYIEPRSFAISVDTAWALLRFFRTGEDWKTQEVKRQWAEEEYAAFLEREKVRLFSKPRLVPLL